MKVPPRSQGAAEIQARRSFVARRVVLPSQRFLNTEGFGSGILLLAAVVALVWANSPWSESYARLQHATITLDLGFYTISEGVQHWVNDGLMTFFFFVVGLEIKRELIDGELNDPRRAALPVAAALGGMIAPALIFAALNLGGPGLHGWGIPIATDIAFAVGALSLLGDRVPAPLRVFLLALAIVDDIGAILVIALFYSHGFSPIAFGVAASLLVFVAVMRWIGFRSIYLYIAVGAIIWAALHESGVHPTIAGVVLGAMTPANAWFSLDTFSFSAQRLLTRFRRALDHGDRDRAEVLLGQIEELSYGTEPILDRLQRTIHPWSSYVILPVFALINSGVVFERGLVSGAVVSPITWGVFLGLFVGKPLGVLAFCWLATRLRLAKLPTDATWAQVGGVGLLAGIGFTVSLFVTELSYSDALRVAESKIGILAASLAAGLIGYATLRAVTRPR